MLLLGSLKVTLILVQIITKKVIMMVEIHPKMSVSKRKSSNNVDRVKSVNNNEELKKKPEKGKNKKWKKREKIG